MIVIGNWLIIYPGTKSKREGKKKGEIVERGEKMKKEIDWEKEEKVMWYNLSYRSDHTNSISLLIEAIIVLFISGWLHR